MTDKLTVALLFGGRSSEHSISCATAGGVLAAIDRDRYNVIPIGITRRGAFVLEADDPEKFALDASSLPEVVGDAGILVNAHDPQDVASALRLMACDESKRLELGQKALDRSRMFSWQRAARETLKVYREAHAETR